MLSLAFLLLCGRNAIAWTDVPNQNYQFELTPGCVKTVTNASGAIDLNDPALHVVREVVTGTCDLSNVTLSDPIDGMATAELAAWFPNSVSLPTNDMVTAAISGCANSGNCASASARLVYGEEQTLFGSKNSQNQATSSSITFNAGSNPTAFPGNIPYLPNDASFTSVTLTATWSTANVSNEANVVFAPSHAVPHVLRVRPKAPTLGVPADFSGIMWNVSEPAFGLDASLSIARNAFVVDFDTENVPADLSWSDSVSTSDHVFKPSVVTRANGRDGFALQVDLSQQCHDLVASRPYLAFQMVTPRVARVTQTVLNATHSEFARAESPLSQSLPCLTYYNSSRTLLFAAVGPPLLMKLTINKTDLVDLQQHGWTVGAHLSNKAGNVYVPHETTFWASGAVFADALVYASNSDATSPFRRVFPPSSIGIDLLRFSAPAHGWTSDESEIVVVLDEQTAMFNVTAPILVDDFGYCMEVVVIPKVDSATDALAVSQMPCNTSAVFAPNTRVGMTEMHVPLSKNLTDWGASLDVFVKPRPLHSRLFDISFYTDFFNGVRKSVTLPHSVPLDLQLRLVHESSSGSCGHATVRFEAGGSPVAWTLQYWSNTTLLGTMPTVLPATDIALPLTPMKSEYAVIKVCLQGQTQVNETHVQRCVRAAHPGSAHAVPAAPLEPVLNFRAQGVTEVFVTASDNTGIGVTTVSIEISVDGASVENATVAYSGPGTRHVATAPAHTGRTVTVRARASNCAGDSDWSTEVSHVVPLVDPVFRDTCDLVILGDESPYTLWVEDRAVVCDFPTVGLSVTDVVQQEKSTSHPLFCRGLALSWNQGTDAQAYLGAMVAVGLDELRVCMDNNALVDNLGMDSVEGIPIDGFSTVSLRALTGATSVSAVYTPLLLGTTVTRVSVSNLTWPRRPVDGPIALLDGRGAAIDSVSFHNCVANDVLLQLRADAEGDGVASVSFQQVTGTAVAWLVLTSLTPAVDYADIFSVRAVAVDFDSVSFAADFASGRSDYAPVVLAEAGVGMAALRVRLRAENSAFSGNHTQLLTVTAADASVLVESLQLTSSTVGSACVRLHRQNQDSERRHLVSTPLVLRDVSIRQSTLLRVVDTVPSTVAVSSGSLDAPVNVSVRYDDLSDDFVVSYTIPPGNNPGSEVQLSVDAVDTDRLGSFTSADASVGTWLYRLPRADLLALASKKTHRFLYVSVTARDGVDSSASVRTPLFSLDPLEYTDIDRTLYDDSDDAWLHDAFGHSSVGLVNVSLSDVTAFTDDASGGSFGLLWDGEAARLRVAHVTVRAVRFGGAWNITATDHVLLRTHGATAAATVGQDGLDVMLYDLSVGSVSDGHLRLLDSDVGVPLWRRSSISSDDTVLTQVHVVQVRLHDLQYACRGGTLEASTELYEPLVLLPSHSGRHSIDGVALERVQFCDTGAEQTSGYTAPSLLAVHHVGTQYSLTGTNDPSDLPLDGVHVRDSLVVSNLSAVDCGVRLDLGARNGIFRLRYDRSVASTANHVEAVREISIRGLNCTNSVDLTGAVPAGNVQSPCLSGLQSHLVMSDMEASEVRRVRLHDVFLRDIPLLATERRKYNGWREPREMLASIDSIELSGYLRVVFDARNLDGAAVRYFPVVRAEAPLLYTTTPFGSLKRRNDLPSYGQNASEQILFDSARVFSASVVDLDASVTLTNRELTEPLNTDVLLDLRNYVTLTVENATATDAPLLMASVALSIGASGVTCQVDPQLVLSEHTCLLMEALSMTALKYFSNTSSEADLLWRSQSLTVSIDTIEAMNIGGVSTIFPIVNQVTVRHVRFSAAQYEPYFGEGMTPGGVALYLKLARRDTVHNGTSVIAVDDVTCTGSDRDGVLWCVLLHNYETPGPLNASLVLRETLPEISVSRVTSQAPTHQLFVEQAYWDYYMDFGGLKKDPSPLGTAVTVTRLEVAPNSDATARVTVTGVTVTGSVHPVERFASVLTVSDDLALAVRVHDMHLDGTVEGVNAYMVQKSQTALWWQPYHVDTDTDSIVRGSVPDRGSSAVFVATGLLDTSIDVARVECRVGVFARCLQLQHFALEHFQRVDYNGTIGVATIDTVSVSHVPVDSVVYQDYANVSDVVFLPPIDALLHASAETSAAVRARGLRARTLTSSARMLFASSDMTSLGNVTLDLQFDELTSAAAVDVLDVLNGSDVGVSVTRIVCESSQVNAHNVTTLIGQWDGEWLPVLPLVGVHTRQSTLTKPTPVCTSVGTGSTLLGQTGNSQSTLSGSGTFLTHSSFDATSIGVFDASLVTEAFSVHVQSAPFGLAPSASGYAFVDAAKRPADALTVLAMRFVQAPAALRYVDAVGLVVDTGGVLGDMSDEFEVDVLQIGRGYMTVRVASRAAGGYLTANSDITSDATAAFVTNISASNDGLMLPGIGSFLFEPAPTRRRRFAEPPGVGQCLDHECKNNAVCVPNDSGYTCACQADFPDPDLPDLKGWSGDFCDTCDGFLLLSNSPRPLCVPSPLGTRVLVETIEPTTMRYAGTNATVRVTNMPDMNAILEHESGELSNDWTLSIGGVAANFEVLGNAKATKFVLSEASLKFQTPDFSHRRSLSPLRVPLELRSELFHFEWYRPDLVYLLDQCYEQNQFLDLATGKCNSCPTGASCPGGARAHPKPGYWSVSETEPPGECTIPDACTGSDINTFNADGTRVTGLCTERYQSDFCAHCGRGFYRDGNRCMSCGGTGAGASVFLLISGSVFFLLVALAVVILPAARLDTVVGGLIALQQLVIVVRSVLEELYQDGQHESAKEFMRVLSVVALDVGFAAPECLDQNSDALGFSDVYWGTILALLCALMVFVCAAFIRALWLGRRFHRPTVMDALRDFFPQRAKRAAMILAVIAYLRVAILVLRSFKCIHSPKNLLLFDDRTLRCFGDREHTSAFVVSLVLLLAHLVCFPIWCFRIAKQAAVEAHSAVLTRMASDLDGHFAGRSVVDEGKQLRHVHNVDDARLAESLRYFEANGYVFRGLRARMFWFRVAGFAVMLCIALQTVLVTDVYARLALVFVTVAINIAVVLIYWPFLTWYFNVLPLVTGALQCITYFAFLASRHKGGLLAALSSIVAVGLVGCVVFRERLDWWRFGVKKLDVRARQSAASAVKDTDDSVATDEYSSGVLDEDEVEMITPLTSPTSQKRDRSAEAASVSQQQDQRTDQRTGVRALAAAATALGASLASIEV